MSVRRFQPPVAVKLKDQEADRFRLSVEGRLRELQSVHSVQGVLIEDIELPDGITVHVSHGLGRKPRFVRTSNERTSLSATTGRVCDVTALIVQAGQGDAAQTFCLKAQGWSETIYCDAWVF